MARLNGFHIETDSGIARALLKPGTETRRQLNARTQLVGIFYRREYSKSAPNRANSIFEQKNQISITDKSAFKVEIINGEIIISINAPAADFAETGNIPGPSDQVMRIRVKSSKVKKTKGKRGKVKYTISDSTRISKYKGKYYLFTKRAKGFEGYGLLRKAIEIAFKV